ncbi:DUF1642 domain-containing protein [uncultured Vagococcus sp.]|uniref:DUF1642 domain-containing protein n=1 Tax=uncultured Vagococcus sp. TaxID=189676 RepID=UPI0028D00CE5|nr:DUF1642 domain-containing protein [uncultured Vagococcus sp.]
MSIKIKATKEEVGQWGKEAAEQIVKEFLGLEMRDATQEERDSVDQYFKKLAKAQGGLNMKETSNQYERLLKSFNDRKSEMSLDDIKAFTEAALQSASLNEEGHKISGQAITDQIDILVNEGNSRFSNDHKAQELENLTRMTIGDIVAKVAAGSFGNIEYNHKVKVPPFMDEFLMFVKKNGDHGIDAYNNLFTICSSWPKEQILEWSFADPDRFLDAVRYGHEVEEEPKYYVAFPALEWNENKAELETKNMYLLHDETSDESNFSLSPRRVRDFVPELTEETIKALDERFWPFAVPVEEVNHDS